MFRRMTVDCIWNVMAHAQKPDFVFQWNGWVHLNRRGRQFSWLPAAEMCASAVVMLDTPSSEAVRRVRATHSIRQFPLHFPSRASPCAITFQLDSTAWGPSYVHRIGNDMTVESPTATASSKLIQKYISCVIKTHILQVMKHFAGRFKTRWKGMFFQHEK